MVPQYCVYQYVVGGLLLGCVAVDKIGKKYISLGVHADIIAILDTSGETANVVTLSLQALSALITSGTILCVILYCSVFRW